METRLDDYTLVLLYDFRFGVSDLEREHVAWIENFAQSFRGGDILLIGSADQPGSFELNQDLSMRRAENVERMLNERLRVPHRITVRCVADTWAPAAAGRDPRYRTVYVLWREHRPTAVARPSADVSWLREAIGPQEKRLFFVRAQSTVSQSIGVEIFSAGTTTINLELSDGTWSEMYRLELAEASIGVSAMPGFEVGPVGASVEASFAGAGDWGWFRTNHGRRVTDFANTPVRSIATGNRVQLGFGLEPGPLITWPNFPLGSGISLSLASESRGAGSLVPTGGRGGVQTSLRPRDLTQLMASARAHPRFRTYGNGTYWRPAR